MHRFGTQAMSFETLNFSPSRRLNDTNSKTFPTGTFLKEINDLKI